MNTTQQAAPWFVRPIRPDALQRAGSKLKALQLSTGVSRADAAQVSRSLIASARLSRRYLDGIRALLRARTGSAAGKVLRGLRTNLESWRDQIEQMEPALARALQAAGNGGNAPEDWFPGGVPQELMAERSLRQQLSQRLTAMGPVRVSDIAHLACLWSDAQRFHAALRGGLRPGGGEGGAFLEAMSGILQDHVLPVDLKGLPGDPGLLEGIPAMIVRLGGTSPTRRRQGSRR